jgi:hypothetical protein
MKTVAPYGLCCIATFVALLLDSSASAQPVGGKLQYFTNGNRENKWTYYKDKECYAIWWKYWDNSDKRYKLHTVYWYPKDPDNYYYYNPEKKEIWGKCVSRRQYSALPEDARRSKVNEIDPKSFPEPDEMPLIPRTDIQMAIPPMPPSR